MDTTPPQTRKLSFVAVVAAPRKQDKLSELEIMIEQLRTENENLHKRVCILETQKASFTQLADTKAKEVEACIKEKTQKEVQVATTSIGHTVKQFVDAGFCEQQMQDKNLSLLRLGGGNRDWPPNGIKI